MSPNGREDGLEQEATLCVTNLHVTKNGNPTPVKSGRAGNVEEQASAKTPALQVSS
jgi:hypothetical protein